MSLSVLLSSKSSLVSGLTFRFLINFELMFVYGVRKYSNFRLLHVAVKFSKHHLLKRLFPPLYILAFFVKNKVTIFLDFYPVPLIYTSVFVPVPYCLDYCSFVV